jgi:hypothetical protein
MSAGFALYKTLHVVREKFGSVSAVALVAKFPERTVAFLRTHKPDFQAALGEQFRQDDAIAAERSAARGDGIAEA